LGAYVISKDHPVKLSKRGHIVTLSMSKVREVEANETFSYESKKVKYWDNSKRKKYKLPVTTIVADDKESLKKLLNQLVDKIFDGYEKQALEREKANDLQKLSDTGGSN
jgi:hypothetical protein